MTKAKHNNHKMISAKDLMSRYKVTYQTVNHYTNFGLLPMVAKIGNVRFYQKGLAIKRLRQIRNLMEEGYSLRLIRKKLIGI